MDLLRDSDQADSNSPSSAQMQKAHRDEKDLALINANAERLNREAEDVLEYQGLP